MNIMQQAKVNRELASLEADLTSANLSEGYITCSKSKASSAIHEAEDNDVLSSQIITSDDNEEVLGDAVTTLSLLTDNSTSQNLTQSSLKMKCHYHSHRVTS